MTIFKTAAIGFVMMAAPAFADGHATGDAAEGENVFKKCKACHSIVDAEGEVIVKGGRNGPNLYGLYTRVAGSEEEFGRKYGDSLVEVGEGGLSWDEANFVAYVADPRDFLRTTLDNKRARSKMSFKLGDEDDAKNVWAYIVSVGPEVAAATE
jgi:cytochrome c